MRVMSFFVGFVCLIAALSFTVWVGGGSPGTAPDPRYNATNDGPKPDPSTVDPPDIKPPGADEHAGHDHGEKDGTGDRTVEEPPTISKTGPYPHVHIEQPNHDFGMMEPATNGEHTFLVRNDGEATLSLRRGASTCQCTHFDILKREVPPGETAEVVVKWKPKDSDRHFQQSLELTTNDPKRSKVKLSVVGAVEPKVVIIPGPPWDVGTYTGSRDSNPFYGTVTSKMLDNVVVESVDIENPERVTINVIPLAEEDPLIAKENFKSGARLEVILHPETPIGSISEKANIRTNIPGFEIIKMEIKGFRSGPIRIYPTQGVRYDPDQMRISLGRFPSNEGKKVQLRMLVSEMEDEFEISDLELDPANLKFTIEKDNTDFGDATRQRFLVTFEVPPGLSHARTLENIAKVKFRTNHPTAKEVTFYLDYVAL